MGATAVGPPVERMLRKLLILALLAVLPSCGVGLCVIPSCYLAYTEVQFDHIWGQASFSSSPSARQFVSSPSIHKSGTKYVLTDSARHRIAIYSSFPTGFEDPEVVLGHSTIHGLQENRGRGSSAVAADTLWSPTEAITASDGRFLVCDSDNNRILIWNSLPTVSGAPADVVIGQPDFTSNTANNGGLSANTLSGGCRMTESGGKLVVLDANNGTPDNNRILIFNSIPTTNFASADVVLGQASFSTTASGCTATRFNARLGDVEVVAGRLYLDDTYNNRLLMWNAIPTISETAADVVIGRPDFTTCSAAAASASIFRNNRSMVSDGTALVVSEYSFWRIKIWDTAPIADVPADTVISQPDFTTVTRRLPTQDTLMTPSIPSLVDGKLVVADQGSARALVWNTIPTNDFQPADSVIGQTSFTNNAYGITSDTVFGGQHGAIYGTRMAISDPSRNRVLLFNSIPTGDSPIADTVLGQTSMNENKFRSQNLSPIVPAADWHLRAPTGVAATPDGKLVVADTSNNRVLIWNTWPTTNGQSASVVLGQPDFVTFTANTGGVSASSLSAPYSVKVQGGKLFVSDRTNNRVLIWNSVPSTQTAADLILGQTSVSGGSVNAGGAAGAGTLNNPMDTFWDGSRLFVADYGNYRVLIWNSFPTTNGQAADVVLGQSDFTTVTAAAVTDLSKLAGGPMALLVTNGKLLVTDYYADRVLVWDSIPTVSATPALYQIGQTDPASTVGNCGAEQPSNRCLYNPVGLFELPDGSIALADRGNDRWVTFRLP